MRTYVVRIAPVGPEGEVMEEVELTVTEAQLITWRFGQDYSDFRIVSIRRTPNGSPIRTEML